MVICSFTKWHVPGDSLNSHSQLQLLYRRSHNSPALRYRFFPLTKCLRWERQPSVGNQLTWRFSAVSSARRGVPRKAGVSRYQLRRAYCVHLFPTTVWSDISLGVWSLPWQGLHHRKWQMLQISASFLRASYLTFTSISLVTGDHVSMSEIWVLRERKQPCSSFLIEETALHVAQIGIYVHWKEYFAFPIVL